MGQGHCCRGAQVLVEVQRHLLCLRGVDTQEDLKQIVG